MAQVLSGHIQKPADIFHRVKLFHDIWFDMVLTTTIIIMAVQQGELKMLKIMVTCGGGFSSSALVTHLNKDAKEKGLGEEVEFVFRPFDFGGIGDMINSVDIVMLCPHLAHNAKSLVAKYPDKPFYVIPTRLYGLMSAVDFYEDAQDAIEGWKETGMNPFHFEGEQTAIKVMRTVSHRKYMASK